MKQPLQFKPVQPSIQASQLAAAVGQRGQIRNQKNKNAEEAQDRNQDHDLHFSAFPRTCRITP